MSGRRYAYLVTRDGWRVDSPLVFGCGLRAVAFAGGAERDRSLDVVYLRRLARGQVAAIKRPGAAIVFTVRKRELF